jgi:Zn ribbon nucleic-acid-binding protein
MHEWEYGGKLWRGMINVNSLSLDYLYCKHCKTKKRFPKTGSYCPKCFTELSSSCYGKEDGMFIVWEFKCPKCGYETGYESNDSY